MSALRIVVAGAGLGGLSAAAHLAKRGHRVTVLEAGTTVGGKAGRIEREGFRFDTGPTLLTLPDTVRRAFRAVDGDLDRDVGLSPIEPVCRYFFHDGTRLDVTGDLAATARAIERAFPGEGGAFTRFMAKAAHTWRDAGEPYLEAPFRGMTDFASRVLRRGMSAVRLGTSLGTLDGMARQYFRTDAMRAFVGRFATYAGGDPSRASAAYSMLPHLELTVGALHPHGGMSAIARALATRLREHGVDVRTNAPVARIVTEHGRVTGVQLASGELLACDAVVANVDPQIVHERWLPASFAAKGDLATLQSRVRSVSGYALLLGVRGDVAPLAHHTVCFPADYPREFADVFDAKRAPTDPTVYVCATSLTEPAAAPPGHHALFVLVNAPATGDTPAWHDCADLDARILVRLERVVPGITARIVVRDRVTPREIAQLGSIGGAIYGEAPHGPTAPFRRPKQRSEAVRGLYFVGGSVHPGGGVPMVTLGGEHVAALIDEDVVQLQRVRGERPDQTVTDAP